MSKGQLGVLHTNSAYNMDKPNLPSRTEDVKLKIIQDYIRDLTLKEKSFFGRFGYSNAKDFIREIRRILEESQNDLRALRHFSSNNLQKKLAQFKAVNSNMFLNQEILLTLKGDEKRIDKIIKLYGSNDSISWKTEVPKTIMLAKWNTEIIKDITNKMASKTFKTGSKNTQKLMNFLRGDGDNYIDIKVGGEQGKTMDRFILDNLVSPFELKPNEFKDMIKQDPSIATKLRNRIEDFLYNDLCAGASKEFIDIVKSIMNQKFPLNKPETLAFFMGGEGWSIHALGAFGELQTSIFFQYIAAKTPNTFLSTELNRIIADELNEYGQQKHTDIELFERFGIQVKNYGSDQDFKTGEEKTVKVNLHPSEIEPLRAVNAVDYIVNSYFNTDIEKYSPSELDTFFESHAAELLNLNISPVIPDQVTFYIVGGHLIPGSELLKKAFTSQTKMVEVHSTISGRDGKSNEEYLPDGAKGWGYPFHEWWESTTQPPTSGNFDPTGKNTIGAWDKYVSIHTTFTYSVFFSADYRLF